MNYVLLFTAVFCALAAIVILVLYLRLRRKYACSEASSQGSQAPADDPSAQLDSMAIDQYLYDRCCRYMTEHRPFLVPTFSLQDLANAIYTNKSYLSKTINRYSGKNFRQYMNYYRVMYAMELYRSNMSLRVNDLGELSGFSSVSAFFQSFKKVMGEPPSTWCTRIRKKYLEKLKNL